MDLGEFELAYVEAMLWSSHNYDTGEPMDRLYGVNSLTPEALALVRDDCDSFRTLAQPELEAVSADDSQNGHDFWLTRNGHGAGFWDRGYPEPLGGALTVKAQTFGECYPFPTGDGKVCIE